MKKPALTVGSKVQVVQGKIKAKVADPARLGKVGMVVDPNDGGDPVVEFGSNPIDRAHVAPENLKPL